MKKFSILATILFVILFFTNCTSIQTVVINTQKPAQITLPIYVENIGIINNLAAPSASEGYSNYKYTKKGEKIKETIKVVNDSSSHILTESLFEYLAESEIFKNVALYEYPVKEYVTTYDEHPLDSTLVKDLSNKLDVQAIISIDKFLITSDQYDDSFDFSSMTTRHLDAKIEAHFAIYSRKGNLLATPFYFTDSIFWSEGLHNSGFKLETSNDTIPPYEEVVKQAAMYTAEKIAKSFSPSWVDRLRMYYANNKTANEFANNNNWVEARRIWKESFNSENKAKKKARYASNIALTYELTDDLENAIKWSEISVQLFNESAGTYIDKGYLTAAQAYRDELIERTNDFKILDIRNNQTEE